MGLFKRLANGLFNPNEIRNYANDRGIYTVLFFLVLLLISIIPHTIQISKLDSINYQTKQHIMEFFWTDEVVEFSISDNKLISNNNQIKAQVFEYTPELLIAFSATNEDLNLGSRVAIVFGESEVYIKQNILQMSLFKYSDYSSLEGINFKDAKSPQNTLFWDTMFSVLNNEFLKVKPLVTFTYMLVIIFRTIFYMLLFSVLIAFFQMGQLRGIYRFPKVWKLSIYCLTPYVFGTVLSVMFNFEILSYIGLFMTVIYGVIMSRSIIKE